MRTMPFDKKLAISIKAHKRALAVKARCKLRRWVREICRLSRVQRRGSRHCSARKGPVHMSATALRLSLRLLARTPTRGAE